MSGVADLVDPLGGSYAVEALTDQIEQRAREYIARIDELGGMVSAIEQRYPQREIERRAYEYQRQVENKQRIVVGVNDFVIKEEPPKGLHHLDPQAEQDRIAEVRAFRKARDEQQTQAALQSLSRKAGQASDGQNNLVVAILDAVKAQATVGEVADALRQVFGEYQG